MHTSKIIRDHGSDLYVGMRVVKCFDCTIIGRGESVSKLWFIQTNRISPESPDPPEYRYVL